MPKLTLLILVALAGLIYQTPRPTQHPQRQISFFSRTDTVLLNDADYTLVQRQAGFDVLVLNKSKLKKIGKLYNPQSTFLSDDVVHKAVGVSIWSSRVPDMVDYYFLVDGSRRIIIFKGNILNFKQTNY